MSQIWKLKESKPGYFLILGPLIYLWVTSLIEMKSRNAMLWNCPWKILMQKSFSKPHEKSFDVTPQLWEGRKFPRTFPLYFEYYWLLLAINWIIELNIINYELIEYYWLLLTINKEKHSQEKTVLRDLECRGFFIFLQIKMVV